jgi:hypothetical protein
LSQRAADPDCPEPNTQQRDAPDSSRDLVILCETQNKTTLFVHNVSNYVLNVTPEKSQTWDTATLSDPAKSKPSDAATSLAASVVESLAPHSCDAKYCAVPPGFVARIEAREPVLASIVRAPGRTISRVVLTSAADEVAGKFRPRAARVLGKATKCYEAGQTAQSEEWGQAWRGIATAGATCPSVLKDLFSSDASKTAGRQAETTGQRLLRYSRPLSGEFFTEGVVALAKYVHP